MVSFFKYFPIILFRTTLLILFAGHPGWYQNLSCASSPNALYAPGSRRNCYVCRLFLHVYFLCKVNDNLIERCTKATFQVFIFESAQCII